MASFVTFCSNLVETRLCLWSFFFLSCFSASHLQCFSFSKLWTFIALFLSFRPFHFSVCLSVSLSLSLSLSLSPSVLSLHNSADSSLWQTSFPSRFFHFFFSRSSQKWRRRAELQGKHFSVWRFSNLEICIIETTVFCFQKCLACVKSQPVRCSPSVTVNWMCCTQGSHAGLKVLKRSWIFKSLFQTLKKSWIWRFADKVLKRSWSFVNLKPMSTAGTIQNEKIESEWTRGLKSSFPFTQIGLSSFLSVAVDRFAPSPTTACMRWACSLLRYGVAYSVASGCSRSKPVGGVCSRAVQRASTSSFRRPLDLKFPASSIFSVIFFWRVVYHSDSHTPYEVFLNKFLWPTSREMLVISRQNGLRLLS